MTVDEMEAFIEEHGLPAFLDHLGLDGAGNTVNELYGIARAAHEALDALGVGDATHAEMIREHGREVTRLRESLSSFARSHPDPFVQGG